MLNLKSTLYHIALVGLILFTRVEVLADIPHMSANWVKAEKMSGDSLSGLIKGQSLYPSWIDSTSCFYYSTRADGSNRYWLVDASTGHKTPIIKDVRRFIRDYAKIMGDTLDQVDFTVYGIDFDKGNTRSFHIDRKGKKIVYDIASGRMREIKKKKEPESRPSGRRTGWPKSSTTTDSAFTMLGCGYDLYLRDNRSGKVTRLTDDGKQDCAHTYRLTTDTVDGGATGNWHGHNYMQVIYDNSGIEEMGFIESLTEGRPKVNTFKMPMPGDSGIRRYSIYWYDADKDEGRYLPIDKYPDQTVELGYDNNGDYIYFTRRSRKADHIDLCRINLKDGEVTEIISEECKPHINLTLFNYRLINGGKNILWWSERTGRGNYYLYDSEGGLLNRVTSGDNLVAGRVERIDSAGKYMIFAGYGGEEGIDPYYRHYYKVNLDGSGQRLLTPGNGNHTLDFPRGRDCGWAIDRYSRIDLPTVMQTVSLDNPGVTHTIDSVNVNALKAAGWKAPEIFSVKAADGVTDLYGIMYKPSDFDPAHKYPIITNVYPGPQDDQIAREFTIDDNGNQSLAELGFIVITAPSRGSSPLRGRDFYTYGYGNMRDYPLADDKNTIETLAASRPYIDLDRVGIYGHSGGAFQTVAAMLTYPDFYKVGVAASGNHDNNIYIQWWGEAFHGLTETTDSVTGKTTFSSSIPTNMELAPNLRGRLMLITGDVDKNVPPSNTYRMADALIKAGKRFDMMVLPGKDHGVMCPYYQNLIRYYFVDNLLSPSAYHIDIINHK